MKLILLRFLTWFSFGMAGMGIGLKWPLWVCILAGGCGGIFDCMLEQEIENKALRSAQK